MNHSLDIIRHILDENLIDARKATEAYLNDILSGAIKEQYKEIAPDMFGEEHHPDGEMKKKKKKSMYGEEHDHDDEMKKKKKKRMMYGEEMDPDDDSMKKKKKKRMYAAEEMKKDKKGRRVKHMHDCAKKVVSEEWGEGTCIHGQHAEPDRNGFVAWYDVEFDHGIEEGVNVNDLEVLVSEAHHDYK